MVVQPYKEESKAYSTVDTFMIILLAGVFIMATAGNEANVKAIRFSTLSYTLMAIVGISPNFYLIGVIIWWIFVKKKFRPKLPCFQKQEPVQLEESYLADDFPDRIAHPTNYEAQTAPLLTVSQERGHMKLNYGSSQSPRN